MTSFSSSRHYIDHHAAKTWHFPENISEVEHLMNAIEICFGNNTLLQISEINVLDNILAIVIHNFCRWFPNSKILFLSINNLNLQNRIQNISNFNDHSMFAEIKGLFTKKDKHLWANKKVFFMSQKAFLKIHISNLNELDNVILIILSGLPKSFRPNNSFSDMLKIFNENSMWSHLRILACPEDLNVKKIYLQSLISNFHLSCAVCNHSSHTDIQCDCNKLLQFSNPQWSFHPPPPIFVNFPKMRSFEEHILSNTTPSVFPSIKHSKTHLSYLDITRSFSEISSVKRVESFSNFEKSNLNISLSQGKSNQSELRKCIEEMNIFTPTKGNCRSWSQICNSFESFWTSISNNYNICSDIPKEFFDVGLEPIESKFKEQYIDSRKRSNVLENPQESLPFKGLPLINSSLKLPTWQSQSLPVAEKFFFEMSNAAHTDEANEMQKIFSSSLSNFVEFETQDMEESIFNSCSNKVNNDEKFYISLDIPSDFEMDEVI